MTDKTKGAMVPTNDHINEAIRLMKMGASIRLSGIPNDPSFLSSNFGRDISAEIANRLTCAAELEATKTDQPAALASRVKVKPLVWSEKTEYEERRPYLAKGWSIESRTVVGRYVIDYFDNTKTYLVRCGSKVIAKDVGSEKASKAAAQAYHDKLVLTQVRIG